MRKAKALKTLMVAGKVYLADQIIPEIEEDQYWRLYEINAVEAIETKKKRKRRTKAEMEAAKKVKDDLDDQKISVQLEDEIVPVDVMDSEEEDKILIPAVLDDALEVTDLPM